MKRRKVVKPSGSIDAKRFIRALKKAGACERGVAICEGLLKLHKGRVREMLSYEIMLARYESSTPPSRYNDTIGSYLVWLATGVAEGGLWPESWEVVIKALCDTRRLNRWITKTLRPEPKKRGEGKR